MSYHNWLPGVRRRSSAACALVLTGLAWSSSSSQSSAQGVKVELVRSVQPVLQPSTPDVALELDAFTPQVPAFERADRFSLSSESSARIAAVPHRANDSALNNADDNAVQLHRPSSNNDASIVSPSVINQTVPALSSASPPVANSILTNPNDVPSATAHEALSLTELESMALSSNPAIARASAAVAAAQGAALQAGLPQNPRVGYEGQQIGSDGQAEQHGLLIGQEFIRHEKRTLSREVACREVQMAQHRLAAQRARVSTDVRIAFYRALRAQRQIDMSSELLRLGQQSYKTAETLFQAKEIARTDVLQAQIEVDMAVTALDTARNQHTSAWKQLGAVTGYRDLPITSLAGDLFAPPPDWDFDSVLSWLRGNSPEIAEAMANVERARFNLQRQCVEPRPNLSVEGLYNFVDNGIGGQPDAGLLVSIPVPVWNRNQGAIQQARYQVVVAEQSLAQLELAMQQRLAPVFERYANAKNMVAQYGQRILPAAAETLKLTQSTFEVGEIGYTNLLIVQRSYRQQQGIYLDAAEALRLSEAEINGLLLTGSLLTQ